jgi:hypothetical protein
VNGEYKFDITLRQSQIYINGLEFPHDLVMLIDDNVVFTQTIGGEDDARAQDQQLATGATAIQARLKNLRFKVTAGPHSIAVTFRQRTLAQSEEVLQPFAGATRDHHPSGWMNGVPTLEKLEVMGPLSESGRGDTASRRRILMCTPTSTGEEPACARTILSTLARRAYRRPITDADLVLPLRFYDAGSAGGRLRSWHPAGADLHSGEPPFPVSSGAGPAGAAPGSVHRLTDLELASRLSFFLWSSIPDDELLREAVTNRLSEPAVLERQVRAC